ncbi:MAG: DsbC family protein [Syntrophales bacterium]
MKRRFFIAPVIVFFALIVAASGFPAPPNKAKKDRIPASAVQAVSVSAEKEVLQKFSASFPGIRAQSAAKTPIEGVYEMTGRGGFLVFYYFPGADMILFGDLIDKNMKSLTQEKKDSIQASKFSQIPLESALVIGNGRHKVIEFTDPDCPHCRRAAEYLKGKDVTKYVFLRPMPALHPRAEEKSKYILAASDKAKAYYDVMSGKLDKEDMSKQIIPSRAMDMLVAHANAANKIGINGTPVFWIDGKYVAGANFRMMDELLK